MNRNRRPMPGKTRKKMEKEVRTAQKELPISEELARSDETSADEQIKRYPKVNKTLIDNATSGMKVKKKKKEHKRSKRTSPGEENEVRESPPAHIHPEGVRWQKTLDLQNKDRRKKLTKKLDRQNRTK